MGKPAVRDPRAAAIRTYTRQAVELRAEAVRCREAGYHYWAVEYEGLAVIAERAAKAEVVNEPPELMPE
jgi:hypothetical protein